MVEDAAKKMIPCPRCLRPLDENWYRVAQVEACAGCGGILADRSTLEELGIDTARLWAEPDRQRAPKIDCPVCEGPMTAITVGGLALDRCDRDAIIWFDGAELMKLIPAEATSSSGLSGIGQFLEGLASLFQSFA